MRLPVWPKLLKAVNTKQSGFCAIRLGWMPYKLLEHSCMFLVSSSLSCDSGYRYWTNGCLWWKGRPRSFRFAWTKRSKRWKRYVFSLVFMIELCFSFSCYRKLKSHCLWAQGLYITVECSIFYLIAFKLLHFVIVFKTLLLIINKTAFH